MHDKQAGLNTTPCPDDTDGDGNCGKVACPYCGRYGKVAASRVTHQSPQDRQVLAEEASVEGWIVPPVSPEVITE